MACVSALTLPVQTLAAADPGSIDDERGTENSTADSTQNSTADSTTGSGANGPTERETVDLDALTDEVAGSRGEELPPVRTTVLAAYVDAAATEEERVEFAESVVETVEEVGGEVRVTDNKAGSISIEVPRAAVDDVKDALEQDGETSVAKSARFTIARTPNDRRFGGQESYLRQINVPGAWSRTTGRSGVRIAVIDTGVANHPELKDKVVAKYDAVYGGRSVGDTVGHGTFVASVAAAQTGNKRGVAGVGWNSSLMIVKVDDNQGNIWGDALGRGIRWAVNHDADVINISLGGKKDDPSVRRAIGYAKSKGVLIVAASGNDATDAVRYPGGYGSVLTVGATDGNQRATFSNRGSWVDVAAPGVGILGADRTGGLARLSGTSFAAPMVAGQAALIYSIRRNATPTKVSNIITKTAVRVGKGKRKADRVRVNKSVLRAERVAMPVRNLRAKAARRNVALNWGVPNVPSGHPVTGYRVSYRSKGGKKVDAGRATTTASQLKVRSLKPGTKYKIKVRAMTKFGLGPSRTKVVTTKA